MWSLTRFCSRVADLTLTASKAMQVRPALNPKLCNQFTFSSCMAVWRSVAIQLEPHLLLSDPHSRHDAHCGHDVHKRIHRWKEGLNRCPKEHQSRSRHQSRRRHGSFRRDSYPTLTNKKKYKVCPCIETSSLTCLRQEELTRNRCQAATLDVWQRGVDTEEFHPRHRSDAMRARMSGGRPDAPILVYIGRLGPGGKQQGM